MANPLHQDLELHTVTRWECCAKLASGLIGPRSLDTAKDERNQRLIGSKLMHRA
jgi:hypothetical protein